MSKQAPFASRTAPSVGRTPYDHKLADSNSAITRRFLHLLSCAIWNKSVNPSLFKDLSPEIWKTIYTFGRRQMVNILIIDKALTLPKECLSDEAMQFKFIADIQQTEALNRKMIKVLANIKEDYNKAGFPFLLLKGLSVAANYPSPLLRSAGDIDLYLYQKGDYEQSKDWIISNGYEIEDGGHMHYTYCREGIVIENHTRFTYFDNKKYDNLLRKQEQEIINKGNFPIVNIDGLHVQQLPIDINALFIFQHMFRHFVSSGVGLRQYSDWLLFLSKHRSQFNIDSFTTLAQSFALLHPMQLFARAAVKYLDAPEEIFPFPMIAHNKYVDMIFKELLQSGNFGYYRPGKQRPKGKYSGMWFSFKNTLSFSLKFGAISPEHIRILPYTKLLYRLKIGFK